MPRGACGFHLHLRWHFAILVNLWPIMLLSYLLRAKSSFSTMLTISGRIGMCIPNSESQNAQIVSTLWQLGMFVRLRSRISHGQPIRSLSGRSSPTSRTIWAGKLATHSNFDGTILGCTRGKKSSTGYRSRFDEICLFAHNRI